MQNPLRIARIVMLLVYPYYYGENPPQRKLDAWIRTAKKLPRDGLFIVASTPNRDDYLNSLEFIKDKLKKDLGERFILVHSDELIRLKEILPRAGFQMDGKTKLYEFGMHTYCCPTQVAEKIMKILQLKGIKSVHLRGLSVLSKDDKILYRKLIKEKKQSQVHDTLLRENLRYFHKTRLVDMSIAEKAHWRKMTKVALK